MGVPAPASLSQATKVTKKEPKKEPKKGGTDLSSQTVPAPIKLGFAPDLSKPINKAHAQPKKKAAPQAKKKTTWGLRHAHAQAARLAPHSNLTAAGLPHSSKSSSDDTWWIVLIVVTILVLIGAALLY